MVDTSLTPGHQIHGVASDHFLAGRERTGRAIIYAASLLLVAVLLIQALQSAGAIAFGFENWRPILYAYLIWSVALGLGQIMIRGEFGFRALFVLPAVLFTVAMVVFPTLFGFYVALTDWNLSAFAGRQFSGFDNFRSLAQDSFYWNALRNMIYYVASVLVEYGIAFGLALLLSAQIRARKFFRVVFLMPFSWMVGKSLLEFRFGPAASLARFLGWDSPAFFASPWIARTSIMVMDGWMFIPFIMILLLAGLQALPREVLEAAKVDGANAWQSFWKITFPLMLPVSVTAIVLRIIFKLKLADIVINVTAGGPGGATDTVTSFIFREYRDRSNVGYGTMLAMFYLVLIIVLVLLFLSVLRRRLEKVT